MKIINLFKTKSTLQKVYIILSLIAVTALCCYIYYLSAETADVSSQTSEGVIAFLERLFGYAFTQDEIRTAAHFCEYALLGFLFINFFYSVRSKIYYIPSALISWVYAWSDEIHQLFVDGRAFQFSDLAVDLGGILSGCLAFTVLAAIIKKIAEHRKEKNGITAE